MSAPTMHRPNSVTAFAALYRLFLRGQLTRLRAVGLALLGGVAIVLTILARSADDPTETAAGVIAEYGLGVVAPVCTLWIATSLLGDLTEDRLLAYLWLKPIPRWVLPLAAFAATVTVMVPLVVVPLTIAAIASGVSELVVATVAASALAVIGYAGIFTALGARFSRALWWGLLYVLVWENAVARIADGTARFAVRSYVNTVVARATDVEITLANRGPVTMIVVPLLIAAAGIAVSTWIMRTRDID
jgi:ABC-2 type transport system permease protein